MCISILNAILISSLALNAQHHLGGKSQTGENHLTCWLVDAGRATPWLPFRCPPPAPSLQQCLEGISRTTEVICLKQNGTGERAGSWQANKLNEVCNRLRKYQPRDQHRNKPQETIN